MKKRLFALSVYFVFWLAFFFFARFVFIISQSKEAFQYSPGILAGTFTHGIRLDISATAYVFILPLLFSILYVWINGDWFRRFMKWYTLIILFISAGIIVVDSVLYTYWGFRMDYTPFVYLKTPEEAAASVTTLELLLICGSVILITLFFWFLYNRFVSRLFAYNKIKYRIPVTLLIMLLCGSLIIPIRGGVGVAPINAGSVYFSENMFINHASINVVWNVGSSFFNRKPARNPYIFSDMDSAKTLVDSLTLNNGVTEKVLNNQKPNILMIILESFGNTLVGPLGGDPRTTPQLNRLLEEGVLFTNFYASGNRTDKALPAILNGYPAQPAVSIIKEPKKSQTLNSLVKIFNGLEYHSAFWYGGDINFANFNSFVIGSGFRQIVTMENFSKADFNSKWGVHDHVMFAALKDSMKTIREPFFRVVLTLSSHEPFEVPMKAVFEGNDNLTKFKNSVYYTDKTVGDFIDWAKNTEWWKNTLVIIVADHCRRNSLEELVYSQEIFKIPMLWIGGAVATPGKRIVKFGSQVDIPVTLLDQLDLKGSFPFGKDLLSDKTGSFAFYTFNEGFAFLTDTSTYIYDHKLGQPVVVTGTNPELTGKYGKAYLQVLYDDYLNR
jgi:phosphoglycerol transferase MdoB-like AlkP superfamily enzyme